MADIGIATVLPAPSSQRGDRYTNKFLIQVVTFVVVGGMMKLEAFCGTNPK